MKEQLIAFDTAKLAREKGFDTVYRDYVYKSKTEIIKEVGLKNYPAKIYPTYYAACTQSLLQKWLREEHNIYVDVKYDYAQITRDNKLTEVVGFNLHVSRGRLVKITDKEKLTYNRKWFGFYDTYEEALEIGLQEALKLIK